MTSSSSSSSSSSNISKSKNVRSASIAPDDFDKDSFIDANGKTVDDLTFNEKIFNCSGTIDCISAMLDNATIDADSIVMPQYYGENAGRDVASFLLATYCDASSAYSTAGNAYDYVANVEARIFGGRDYQGTYYNGEIPSVLSVIADTNDRITSLSANNDSEHSSLEGRIDEISAGIWNGSRSISHQLDWLYSYCDKALIPALSCTSNVIEITTFHSIYQYSVSQNNDNITFSGLSSIISDILNNPNYVEDIGMHALQFELWLHVTDSSYTFSLPGDWVWVTNDVDFANIQSGDTIYIAVRVLPPDGKVIANVYYIG